MVTLDAYELVIGKYSIQDRTCCSCSVENVFLSHEPGTGMDAAAITFICCSGARLAFCKNNNSIC